MGICADGCENVQNLTCFGSEPAQDALFKFDERTDSSLRSISLKILSGSLESQKYFAIIQPFVKASFFIELCLYGLEEEVPENLIRRLAGWGVLVRGSHGIPSYLCNALEP